MPDRGSFLGRTVRRLSVKLLLVPVVVAGLLPGVVTSVGAQTAPTAPSPAPVAAPDATTTPVDRQAVATGTGGAVATVDPVASAAGLEVLAAGGNAVDAAVATAAVLGVTEPYSAGIGGGGFMLVYLADEKRVVTVDSRETAPQSFRPDSFVDPATGQAIPLAERVTSGLSAGVPGTVRGWDEALRRYGSRPLRQLLRPAIRTAQQGFPVDQTFADQTAANLERFRQFSSTSEVFLTPGGAVPSVGSTLRNPDLAETYRQLAREGADSFYDGDIADAIASAVNAPPTVAGATANVRPGNMTAADLADYEARIRRPTVTGYRDLDVYSMGPPSSGGTTVAEALNILEGSALGALPREEALHRYLEASRLAFADRNAYVGDPEFVDVPVAGLLSAEFAAERVSLIGDRAATSPVPAGDPFRFQTDPSTPLRPVPPPGVDGEGPSTTHLTVSDREGNVVSYTFTIESTGGNGIVVPGYGFLLNNQLTDFEAGPPHPNAPEAGKRPRSSMAPTIVLRDGEPVVALGSPGGATIITTVLQVLVNHVDFGMALPDAIAAPRLSQRNTATTQAEPGFAPLPEASALVARGHAFAPTAEIGAATGIAFLDDGSVQAAAEPARRGGGSALIERPAVASR